MDINSDGTVIDNGAGWGALIRDLDGKPLSVGHGKLDFTDINMEEVNAVEEGIKLAQLQGCTKVLRQCDSANANEYIKRKRILWKIKHTVRRIN